MKSKWLIRIGLVVVLLLIVGIVATRISLNNVIHSEILRQASASLNVPTTVGAVNLAWTGDALSVANLNIGSPPNFSAQPMMQLGAANVVAVNRGELLGSNPAHLQRVALDGTTLVIDRVGGRINLQALLHQPSRIPQQATSNQGSNVLKMIIDEVDVSNATVRFERGLTGGNDEITVSVPGLTLTDVGGEGGATVKDVVLELAIALAGEADQAPGMSSEARNWLDGRLGTMVQEMEGELGSINLPGDLQARLRKAVTVRRFGARQH